MSIRPTLDGQRLPDGPVVTRWVDHGTYEVHEVMHVHQHLEPGWVATCGTCGGHVEKVETVEKDYLDLLVRDPRVIAPRKRITIYPCLHDTSWTLAFPVLDRWVTAKAEAAAVWAAL